MRTVLSPLSVNQPLLVLPLAWTSSGQLETTATASCARMPGPPRLPLDPYPQFLLSSLDIDLDNLDQLHPYQLALVHFSPLATPEQRLRADVLWWQKRREAIEGSGEEVGWSEASAGLRQMKRAREWLEGKVPGSSKMRDTGVQTDPPPAPPPTTPQRAVRAVCAGRTSVH